LESPSFSGHSVVWARGRQTSRCRRRAPNVSRPNVLAPNALPKTQMFSDRHGNTTAVLALPPWVFKCMTPPPPWVPWLPLYGTQRPATQRLSIEHLPKTAAWTVRWLPLYGTQRPATQRLSIEHLPKTAAWTVRLLALQATPLDTPKRHDRDNVRWRGCQDPRCRHTAPSASIAQRLTGTKGVTDRLGSKPMAVLAPRRSGKCITVPPGSAPLPLYSTQRLTAQRHNRAATTSTSVLLYGTAAVGFLALPVRHPTPCDPTSQGPSTHRAPTTTIARPTQGLYRRSLTAQAARPWYSSATVRDLVAITQQQVPRGLTS